MRAARLQEFLDPRRRELCEALRLPPDADQWAIRSAIDTVRSDIKEHPAQARLKKITATLRYVLESEGWRDKENDSVE